MVGVEVVVASPGTNTAALAAESGVIDELLLHGSRNVVVVSSLNGLTETG